MPRNVTIYQDEVKNAIKKFQDQGCAVILRRYIEEDVKAHPENYPKLAALDEIPRKMAITATVNRIPGTKMYFKRPASWIVTDCHASEGVYG